jgi:hypothetical protein
LVVQIFAARFNAISNSKTIAEQEDTPDPHGALALSTAAVRQVFHRFVDPIFI